MCELIEVCNTVRFKNKSFENADEFKCSMSLMDAFLKNESKTISQSIDPAVKFVHDRNEIKLTPCENENNNHLITKKEWKRSEEAEPLQILGDIDILNSSSESDEITEASKSTESSDSSLTEIYSTQNKAEDVDIYNEKLQLTGSGSGFESNHNLTPKNEVTKKEDTLIHKSNDLFDSTIKWLETVHLEKFNRFFGSLTYDEMINLDDTVLEKNEITKGARQRILIAVSKLRERLSLIKEVKSNIDDGGSLVLAIKNLKNILNGPICSNDKENLPEKFIEVLNLIGQKLLKNCHLHTELFLFMKLTNNVFRSNCFAITYKRTLFSLCNDLMKMYQLNIKNNDWDPAVKQMMSRILAANSVQNVDMPKNDQRSNEKTSNQKKYSRYNEAIYKKEDRKTVFEIAKEPNTEKRNVKAIEDGYKCVKPIKKCNFTNTKTKANDVEIFKNEQLIAETTALNMPKIHVYNKYQKETKKNETPEDFSYFSYEWLNEKIKIKPEKSGDKDSLESMKSFFERRDNENRRCGQQATNESFAMPHIILEKSCIGFVCEDVRFLPDPQCKPFNNFMKSDV